MLSLIKHKKMEVKTIINNKYYQYYTDTAKFYGSLIMDSDGLNDEQKLEVLNNMINELEKCKP